MWQASPLEGGFHGEGMPLVAELQPNGTKNKAHLFGVWSSFCVQGLMQLQVHELLYFLVVHEQVLNKLDGGWKSQNYFA
jgi:hypothetical protein